MKIFKYIVLSLFAIALGVSCSDDDEKKVGNPVMDIKSEFSSAMFGDSLPFTINVSDEVPLSTLKARIYYGEEKVSESVLRTKTEGEYSGKVYIPFLKDIPNGNVKLEFVLQNINFTLVSKTYDLSVTRPVYPYLTLITADKEYKMLHKSGFDYELTEALPQEVKGYIKSPTVTAKVNEMTFGWDNNSITQGSVENITFVSMVAGEYTISFNTLNYSAAPFIDIKVNGASMESVADGSFKIDLSLTQGQEIVIDGIGDFDKWWIDTDFFGKSGEKLTFSPIGGKYRISADPKLKYLKVEVLSGNDPAGLKEDGTGAIWIIGDSQGKPSLTNTGWDPTKAICMAPMGNGKYKISFVAGETIKANGVNFVFFHVKNWSPSFGPETLTVNSSLVRIGTRTSTDPGNGVDKGNIALEEGKTLTAGKTYEFVIDVSAGIDKAILTVVEK